MGWPILIGQYYSLTLIGVVIGFLYPIYYFYFGVEARNDNVDQNLKQPLAFFVFAVVSSFRFGLFSFLVLTVLAIVAGILFSLWALLVA